MTQRQLPTCLLVAAQGILARPSAPVSDTAAPHQHLEPGIHYAANLGVIYANQLTRKGDLAGAGAVLAFCAGLRAEGVG